MGSVNDSKEVDYFIRACREKEIFLLKKKCREENRNILEEHKKMFKIHIQKLKGKHEIKKQLKQDAKTYKKYNSYFLKMFKAARHECNQFEKKKKCIIKDEYDKYENQKLNLNKIQEKVSKVQRDNQDNFS